MDEAYKRMTLEEKAGLCSGADFWHLKGVERLDIPKIMVSDGPNGLRKQKENAGDVNDSVEAVCFPNACATAASFDKELIYGMGETLGNECQAENVAMLLGPGANIKRSPLCGRNFEYFSEDPCLSGDMAAALIRGVQSKHVGACLKHFALNNQETRRMTVDVRVDERTMHEIYLSSFERAVKKGRPYAVMCAYNKVNGTYMSENPLTLNKILRKKWGFDGLTLTDWGACNDHVLGVRSGLDVEMPFSGEENDKKLIEAVRTWRIPMQTLDDAARRVLKYIYRYAEHRDENAVFDRGADHHAARKIARDSMVLLKNEDNILPLKSNQKIAFIGKHAKEPRFQGSGSSRINTSEVLAAVDAARGAAYVQYAQGFDDKTDEIDTQMQRDATELAKNSDTVVLFLGLPGAYESEGFDRKHMRLPQNQMALLQAVYAVNHRIVVVLHNGSPVEMPWLPMVKGLLEAYLCGQACGGAAVDLLFGAVSPSGKLPETFPLHLEDTPCFLDFPGEGDTVHYRENVYVGYRWYDKRKMPVLFPFGFGLSYTTFEYKNIRVDKEKIGTDDQVTVSVDVKNTGACAGKEAVQLYVSPAFEPSVSRPVRELKAFEKIELAPDETKTVAFTLSSRDFAYFEPKIHDWYAENGDYLLEVAASSRDIRQTARVTVTGAEPLPVHYTPDTTVGDLMKNETAKTMLQPFYQAAMAMMNGGEKLGDAGHDMVLNMILDMPLHALKSHIPVFTDDVIKGLLKKLNQ